MIHERHQRRIRVDALILYNRGEFLVVPLRQAAVKMAQVKKGDKFLDICTGTGEVAAWFVREGAKVIGIDLSPDMLKVARSKYPTISSSS